MGFVTSTIWLPLSTCISQINIDAVLHAGFHWPFLLFNTLSAIFGLRSIVACAAAHAGQLHANIAPLRGYTHMAACERSAALAAHSDTQSGGFSQNEFGKALAVFCAAEHCEQHARTALLHLYRCAESVQRAVLQRLLHYVTEDLRRHVVHIGFNHRDFFHREW